MAQVAIAWIVSKPGVVAPVIGATKLSNLQDTIGESSMLRLRPEVHSRAASVFPSGVGCQADGGRDQVLGGAIPTGTYCWPLITA